MYRMRAVLLQIDDRVNITNLDGGIRKEVDALLGRI